MSDEVRVLVTGSRYYGNVARVREAVRDVEAVYAGWSLVLVHGRCAPRHPQTRAMIAWDAAEEFTLTRRLELLGGDWLMAQVAGDREWTLEAHSADWAAGKQAGFQRNARMVGLGAGVVVALTEQCDIPGCTQKRGAHITHGTDHCAGIAEVAGIKVWRYPAGITKPVSDESSEDGPHNCLF